VLNARLIDDLRERRAARSFARERRADADQSRPSVEQLVAAPARHDGRPSKETTRRERTLHPRRSAHARWPGSARA
jgi:hypothetical protein